MSAPETHRPMQPSRQTVAEAAAWITRLHAPSRSPDVEAAFRTWLAASEEHARAFEGMTELWETVPAVSTGTMPRVAVWDPRVRMASWSRVAVLTFACAVVTLAVYWLWPNPGYSTDIGEQRIVNLRDGTRVSMNSGTRMAVAYDETERRIVLKEGEAFFEVAPDARVPFVVVAGDHRVTAVGTTFSVRQETGRTAVTLVEGRVMVAPGSTVSSLTLSPGERLTLVAAQPPKLDTPRVDAVTAWRRGEIILDDSALADAVAEMNRYGRIPIVIDSQRIAALPVSGIYRTGDTTGFARIVARMYELTVADENGRIHLRENEGEAPR